MIETRNKFYKKEPNSFDPFLELYYGISLLQQQKTDETTAILAEIAAQQFDKHFQEYSNLLTHWKDSEGFNDFLSVLKNIENEVPERPYIPLFIAGIELANKNYPVAEAAFYRAEEKMLANPNNADSFLSTNFYYQFALCKERAGKYEDAEALFKKSIELNPKISQP